MAWFPEQIQKKGRGEREVLSYVFLSARPYQGRDSKARCLYSL